MTSTEIGNYAGIIWGVLVRKGQMTIREIGEHTKLRDASIYAALGWLSREDKVDITHISDSISIGLKNMGSEVYF